MMEKCYWKDGWGRMNCEAFCMFVKSHKWIRFYQPSPQKAPWHWQCQIKGEGPYDVLVNFWPHTAKAQRDGCKSVEGWDAIRALVSQIMEENGFDDGEVLE